MVCFTIGKYLVGRKVDWWWSLYIKFIYKSALGFSALVGFLFFPFYLSSAKAGRRACSSHGRHRPEPRASLRHCTVKHLLASFSSSRSSYPVPLILSPFQTYVRAINKIKINIRHPISTQLPFSLVFLATVLRRPWARSSVLVCLSTPASTSVSNSFCSSSSSPI